MGIPKANYPSKSKPGKEYTIYEAADGSHYCDCWQWKRNKTCAHLRHFEKGEPAVPVKVREVTGDKDVENVIDNVINNFFPSA